MESLLMRLAVLALAAALPAAPAAAELSNRHELSVTVDWRRVEAHTALSAWPQGGIGKLRFDAQGSGPVRLAAEYRIQLSSELFGHVVADYVEGAINEIGVTEAFLEWRPLPRGPSRHRFRFGALYPPLSFENSGRAWESPYTRSYSAVNAWLGEEIRPIGAEWRMNRPLGAPSAPQELRTFAGVFYGNDPAGTLLYWRGWAVHDRQIRLNERLPLAALVLPRGEGKPPLRIERRLDPIAEIDHEPGIYVGAEWSYRQRVRTQLAYYDNRADPLAFRDGQWGWGTRFWLWGMQAELPGGLGLVAQRMRGDTDWLTATTSAGARTPATARVTDEFASHFVLLSRPFGRRHRLSLRRDEFEMWREPDLVADRGRATTLAYTVGLNERLEMQLEWLEIESTRDLWPRFYAEPARTHGERVVQLGFRLVLFDSRN